MYYLCWGHVISGPPVSCFSCMRLEIGGGGGGGGGGNGWDLHSAVLLVKGWARSQVRSIQYL